MEDLESYLIVDVENGKAILNPNVRSELIEYQKRKARAELLEQNVKKDLKELLESNENITFEDDIISARLTKASTRTNVDSKRLKEELPEVFENYSKTINVNSSVSLSYDL